jgi:hypothetical protein
MADDRMSLAEIACPKCRLIGCNCDSLPERKEVCVVCHRNVASCICASHATYEPVREEGGELQLERDTPTARIDAAVREAMHCYYQTRDAKAIERLVRELANKAYRA